MKRIRRCRQGRFQWSLSWFGSKPWFKFQQSRSSQKAHTSLSILRGWDHQAPPNDLSSNKPTIFRPCPPQYWTKYLFPQLLHDLLLSINCWSICCFSLVQSCLNLQCSARCWIQLVLRLLHLCRYSVIFYGRYIRSTPTEEVLWENCSFMEGWRKLLIALAFRISRLILTSWRDFIFQRRFRVSISDTF